MSYISTGNANNSMLIKKSIKHTREIKHHCVSATTKILKNDAHENGITFWPIFSWVLQGTFREISVWSLWWWSSQNGRYHPLACWLVYRLSAGGAATLWCVSHDLQKSKPTSVVFFYQTQPLSKVAYSYCHRNIPSNVPVNSNCRGLIFKKVTAWTQIFIIIPTIIKRNMM